MHSKSPSIILFDGDCGFCSRSVRFILRRDPARRFQFASNKSEVGKTLLRERGLPETNVGSIVLIEGDRHWTKSTASLRIARRLKWPWPVFYAGAAVPRKVRDWAYDLFARNRHKWFAPQAACELPEAGDRSRFLDSQG
jgi:predicted DCC family thiol-disulfide oxidoreductase YuxK